MAPGAAVRFAPHHKWDHNFFLLYVVLIWVGVSMGFGPEIAHHFEKHKPPYPLIVHIHAAAMVGWLVLLTVQVLLIRAHRRDIHRRLGVAGVVLAVLMVILGPATALTMDGLHFGTPESDPPFLSVQLADILAFAGLVIPAIALRNYPAVHKRLILLATLNISDAGFARWLGGAVHARVGDGFWPFLAEFYLANDILIVGLGVYDLVTRRRLHTAYIAGAAWIFANQMTASWLYHDPHWALIAVKLIGH
jgi:hypothetical protein